MSNEVLDRVKDIEGYPCVSLIIPTHRTSPENQQDAIRLKNAVAEAKKRLETEFEKRERDPLFEKLDQAMEEIDHIYNKKSLAVFVNKEMMAYTRLPVSVEERVIIDENFATRDLMRELNQAQHYYLMVLTRDEVSLFEVMDDEAQEIEDYGFPAPNYVVHYGEIKDKVKIEEYFHEVDKKFAEVFREHPADLVLAGVDRNITHYQAVSDHTDEVLTTLSGDFSEYSKAELVGHAKSQVKAAYKKHKQEELALLEKAVSVQKFSSDLKEIWKMVNQGRGDTLFVEKNFFQPAKIDQLELELVEDSKAPGVVDDIVDEIAERTLEFGGNVVFVDDGKLNKFERIALVDRY